MALALLELSADLVSDRFGFGRWINCISNCQTTYSFYSFDAEAENLVPLFCP
jgi:hypothetical protein